MKKSWTTGEAAKAVKISRASLQEWIRLGKITAPAVQLAEGKAVRLFTAREVEKLRKVKSEIYGQGKGKTRELRRAR